MSHSNTTTSVIHTFSASSLHEGVLTPPRSSIENHPSSLNFPSCSPFLLSSPSNSVPHHTPHSTPLHLYLNHPSQSSTAAKTPPQTPSKTATFRHGPPSAPHPPQKHKQPSPSQPRSSTSKTHLSSKQPYSKRILISFPLARFSLTRQGSS